MRNFLFHIGILSSSLILLSSCGSNSSLMSSSEGTSDDVYFPEKNEKSLAGTSRAPKERVSANAENSEEGQHPDYYDPKVAEQLRYEQLRRRNSRFYRNDGIYDRDGYYRNGGYYRSGYGYGSGYYYYPQRNNSLNNGTNSYNNNNGGPSGGDSGNDSGGNDSRNRSYDSSDNKRKR